MNNNKQKKKGNWGLIFLLANVAIIVILGIIEFGEGKQVFSPGVFKTFAENWIYIIMAFVACLMALLCEGLKYVIMIKSTTGKWRLTLALKTGIIGKYYDNITPFGAGGQPFQIYYLNKDGIDTGASASIPIVNFFLMQISFIIIALIFSFGFKNVTSDKGLLILSYVGIAFYTFIPLMIVIFSLMPRTMTKVIYWVINILSKIRIIKNKTKAIKKSISALEKYNSSLRALSKQWFAIILSFILSIIYQVFLALIPYFVLRACGYNSIHWIDVVGMYFFVMSAIAIAPTPGNSIAAEGTFYLIFKVLAEGYLFWGTLIWRLAGYYLMLLAGLIVLLNDFIRKRKISKEEDTNLELENQNDVVG